MADGSDIPTLDALLAAMNAPLDDVEYYCMTLTPRKPNRMGWLGRSEEGVGTPSTAIGGPTVYAQLLDWRTKTAICGNQLR